MISSQDQDNQFLQVRIDFLKDLLAKKQLCLFNAFTLLKPEALSQREQTQDEFSRSVNESFYKFLHELEGMEKHPLYGA